MRRGGERTFSRFGYDLSCFLLCVQECCDSLCCENMASERELRDRERDKRMMMRRCGRIRRRELTVGGLWTVPKDQFKIYID